ncbi:hypothetical protein Cgig2_033750 [Carnegiea gigantea]|uniref:Uncharacterized protein n=1 Tax=Carnegiea gigantea TaxID=171969 RepID=A0A9Q1K1M4_9CARY|nr:hypothetical protein Cgig2_033750 [Carnegiea gigantea]
MGTEGSFDSCPRPLPSDYHGLCLRFDLGVATRYAHNSNTPEMVQIIFYTMVIGAALPFSFPTFRDTAQAAKYVRDNLRWSVRESLSLRPNLLPLYFMAYCPEFDHIMAMQFEHTAHIPEMMQAIFHAMVINGAAELRLIKRETGESLMLALQELRWDIIEAWLLSIEDKLKDAQRRERKKREMVRFPNFTSTEMAAKYVRETFRWPLRETLAQRLRPLPEDHLILCPSFDLGMATRYAQDCNILEMVQAIFYAMVMNEVAERGITYRISAGCLMCALQLLHWDPFEFWFENVECRLRGARASRLVNPPTDLTSSNGSVEASGLSDTPPVLRYEE